MNTKINWEPRGLTPGKGDTKFLVSFLFRTRFEKWGLQRTDLFSLRTSIYGINFHQNRCLGAKILTKSEGIGSENVIFFLEKKMEGIGTDMGGSLEQWRSLKRWWVSKQGRALYPLNFGKE